jgi:CDP-ribitol ribitolphosphotransferase
MKMRLLGVSFLKGGAFLIYSLFKLLPTSHKVVLISRLQNYSSVDFLQIQKEASALDPTLKVVTLNHKMDSRLRHVFSILREMYHLATSEACIVESYVISVSILKHRKSLVIVQIWHALGAVKKFGHMAIGKPEGSSVEIARVMKMHENYTYVVAGSKATVPTYAAAFNIDAKRIKPIGMPRVDYLVNDDEQQRNSAAVRDYYNLSADKPVILYAPTFRKRHKIPYETLIEAVDLDRYTVIIKQHPRDKTNIKTPKDGVIIDDHFSVLQVLPVTDYVITDFSATVFEAALLHKPIFFWLFDEERYTKKRGLAMDYVAELPGMISREISDLTTAIAVNHVDTQRVKEFADRYIAIQDGSSTKEILKLAGVVS